MIRMHREDTALDGRSNHPRRAGETHARRRGRRAMMTAYYLVVVGFILAAGGNVAWQVWSPVFQSYPTGDCRAGLRQLAKAIERARQAAGNLSEASEDEALRQFRSALSPDWDRHDAIVNACRPDSALSVALDVIERLRYAEERAVRREVSDLAPLRRKVGQICSNELER
jgi:hypothetical protein